MLKSKIYKLLSILLFISVLGVCYKFLVNNDPLEFDTYSSITGSELSKKDYKQIVEMHNQCFEADKKKYLMQFLSESKYLDSSSSLKPMLKKKVEKYIEQGRIEKIKNFKHTKDLTLLRRSGQVLGMYNCHYDDEATDGSIMIYNVCVDPKQRGKKYGEGLMKHAIENCSKGAMPLTLTVYEDNFAASSLYKKLNFEIIPKTKSPKDEFTLFKKHLMQYNPR